MERTQEYVSTEERYQTIGKAVEQYGENERKVETLMHRAQTIGGSLSEVGRYLADFGKAPKRFSETNRTLNILPPFDVLKEVMCDVHEALAERRRLSSILQEAGVPVR